MADTRSYQEAARFLWNERQARRPFVPIPEPHTPRHIEDAYAVQTELQQLLTQTYGPIAGHKIALTTPVMQKMVGFDEPIAGAIMEKTIHHTPAQVRLSDYGRLGVECEIAVQLAQDLPAERAPYTRDSVAEAIGIAVQLAQDLPAERAPYTRDSVAEAIGSVMAAFELVDDRHADYTKIADHILTLLADNTWNGGIVLGSPLTDWQPLDLAALHGTMHINGEVVGEGDGRDVMGHPLDALAWLASTLAAQGKTLSRGMVVMTGSVVATKFVSRGDRVQLRMDGLGEVELRIE